jgi:cyanophycinase
MKTMVTDVLAFMVLCSNRCVPKTVCTLSTLLLFTGLALAQHTTPGALPESLGITGDANDVTVPTTAGTVLMGGSTDVDQALQWMINRAQGGDVVIIRASGSTGYNEYIYGLGNVNSVETLLIDSREKAMREAVGRRIREAEMLFIAGGDQWNYVKYWKDTEVSKALQYLIDEKKIPIGGTSAGCAVLTGIIFDASYGSAVSKEVLNNPYDTTVSISPSFIQVPFLENTISDQHYSQRERKGRHITFMARMMKDYGIKQPKGIGVDEKTALCIDEKGNAFVFGTNSVYFLISTPDFPEQCKPDMTLTWDVNQRAVHVHTYHGSTQGTPAFNIKKWPASSIEHWCIKDGVLKRVVTGGTLRN